MGQNGWKSAVEGIAALLSGASFRDRSGAELGPDGGFTWWRDTTVQLRNARRTIFLVGNGASASMASHMAADLAKNAHLHTQVFSDLSLLTAIANDMGYEQVFAEPLRRRARAGDLLVAISSSGGSPNVLSAVDLARELDLTVVTLSAMKPDNPLRGKGDLNVYVAASDYGGAETCHAAILHHWMDLVEIRADAT